jgi:PAS domain S-box-containing protein
MIESPLPLVADSVAASPAAARPPSVVAPGDDPLLRDPLAYIAQISDVLAESLDLGQTLERLVRMVVPSLADVCSVHVLDDDGRLLRVARHADPQKASSINEHISRNLIEDGATNGPIHQVLASGQALRRAPLTEADLGQLIGADQAQQVFQTLALTSAMVIPFIARGRALGVMALATIDRPAFTEAHQRLGDELACRVAIAIDNAQLQQAAITNQRLAEESRARATFLAEASAALASSLDIHTTLHTVVKLAVPRLADACSIVLVEPDGTVRRVAVAHADPARQLFIDRHSDIIPMDPSGQHPISQVLATGEPFIDNAVTAATEAQYADGPYRDFLRGLAIRAKIIVPLEARGRRIGTVILTTSDPARTFGTDDVTLCSDLGRRAALALDNARLYHEACVARERLEEQHGLSEAILQHIAEGILVADRAGMLTYVNPSVEHILGWTPAQLLGRRVHDILHVRDAAGTPFPRSECPVAGIYATGTRVHLNDEHFIRADGVVIPVEITSSPLVQDGKIVGGVTVFRDVSVPRQQREALRRLLDERQAETEELRHVHRRLQRSLAALLGIHEVAKLLTSVSDLNAAGRRLLEIAVGAANLHAAALRHRDVRGRLRLWQRVGAEAEDRAAWKAPALAEGRAHTLASGQPSIIELPATADNPARTSWCIPLRIKGEVIGILEALGEPRPADEPTLDILGSIALQAATALENVRLYRDVADSEQALRRLVHQLMTAQEDERRRLANDIHDGFAQLAAGVQQVVEAYAHQFPGQSSDARQRLDVAIGLARRTVVEIRAVLAGLRPSVLEDFGLERALRAHAAGLDTEGLAVTFTGAARSLRLPDDVEIALFRVAQEALTNIQKHANVPRADLRLLRNGNHLVLEVRDHGCGFDVATAGAGASPGEHLGLLSMSERIAQVAGTLEITSECGAGTLVRAVVPVARAAERASLRRSEG